MFDSLNDFRERMYAVEDFYDLQHFLLGCVSYLRPAIQWPKVKDAYQKCKTGLGVKSMFLTYPTTKDFAAFKREERKGIQFGVYKILGLLQMYTSIDQLRAVSAFRSLNFIWDFIPKIQVSQIWDDTVIAKPKQEIKTYPLEVRRMGWEIRNEEKYSELGVLGDLCEELGLQEEADHFHDFDHRFVHTYACRYLHQVCRGMDGR